jgi:enamine deaminase RidA (YjgF/YER057c/UK114 family)
MQGITLGIAPLVWLLAVAPEPSLYRYIPLIECAAPTQCLDALFKAAGPARIAAVSIYLRKIADYKQMNAEYERRFGPQVNDGWKPARNTSQVALTPGMTMGIDAVLYIGDKPLKGFTPPNVHNPVPITPAIRTPDRLFIAGILGRDSNTATVPAAPTDQIEMCWKRLENVLSTARLRPQDLLQITVAHTASIPRRDIEIGLARFPPVALTLIEVAALPLGANISIHGQAAVPLPSPSQPLE